MSIARTTQATEQNAEAIRRLIDETLLQGPLSKPQTFFDYLYQCARKRGIRWEPEVVLEHWWWLARLGVLAFSGELGMTGNAESSLPSVLLTKHGRRLLERGEQSPHNPQRYCRAIEQHIGTPDKVVMNYLNEAVGAWAGGLYRASAVMLGCACEQLIIMLAHAVSEGNIQPWSDKLKKLLSNKSPVGISKLFEEIRNALLDLARKKTLPGNLADGLDRKLTPIFDHARGLRNRAGHPTAAEVTSDEAEGNLLLFPGFYFLVADLVKYLP